MNMIIAILSVLLAAFAGGLMGAFYQRWLHGRRARRSLAGSIRYAEHHRETDGGAGTCRR
jgi:hypothetical protein